MKVLIIGADGYLAQHLIYILKSYGAIIMAVGRSLRSVEDTIIYRSVDITDYDQVRTLDLDVDFIFLFAGKTGTTDGFEKFSEFILSNEIGLLNILTHHNLCKARARIIFPSSRLVYQGLSGIKLTENSPKNPLTIYAQNKIACENYLKIYQVSFDIKYTIFRICVPYGNIFDQKFSYGTIGFFLNSARSKKNITIFGSGSQRRTFTHALDIAQCIYHAIQSPNSINEILNIGGPDNISVYSVAQAIADKYHVKVLPKEWPDLEKRIETGDTMFNDTKLKSLIPYNYEFNIFDWISSLRR